MNATGSSIERKSQEQSILISFKVVDAGSVRVSNTIGERRINIVISV